VSVEFIKLSLRSFVLGLGLYVMIHLLRIQQEVVFFEMKKEERIILEEAQTEEEKEAERQKEMKISPFECVPFLCVGVCMNILGIY